MTKVHVVRQDTNWSPLGADGKDYKSFRHEAELINVVRQDGNWVGIVAWSDGSGITEVEMAEVEEWYDFDRGLLAPPGW